MVRHQHNVGAQRRRLGRHQCALGRGIDVTREKNDPSCGLDTQYAGRRVALAPIAISRVQNAEANAVVLPVHAR